MSDFSYVCQQYGVPACYGRRVVVNGKGGTILEDHGHYIGVNFDADKPGVVLPCHPTSNVKYLDLGEPRRLSRSQQRYRDYLRSEDVFESFVDYLKSGVAT